MTCCGSCDSKKKSSSDEMDWGPQGFKIMNDDTFIVPAESEFAGWKDGYRQGCGGACQCGDSGACGGRPCDCAGAPTQGSPLSGLEDVGDWVGGGGAWGGESIDGIHDVRLDVRIAPSTYAKWSDTWAEGFDVVDGGLSVARHAMLSESGGGLTRLGRRLRYGPWQCYCDYEDACKDKCKALGLEYCGCIWLADVDYDFPLFFGAVIFGGSLALTHCVCDYPETPPKKPREKWDRARERIRRDFGEGADAWPENSPGKPMDGHHIHDLGHGGDPTDPNNILPVPPDVHKALNKAYIDAYKCDGKSEWSKCKQRPRSFPQDNLGPGRPGPH